MPDPSTVAESARGIALEVLCDWEQRAGRVGEAFDERLQRVRLGPADRGLVRELVYGVIQRRETLDSLLRTVVKRPLSQIEPDLHMLLRLGTYQLTLLTHIPPHAAVHETVELARHYGPGKWTGFVNGVLRSLLREVVGDAMEPAPEVQALSAQHLPLTSGRFRQLRKDVFPSPHADPTGYFAAAFSFPRWLAERWGRRYEFAELVRLGFWFNTPGRMCLRVNALRGPREAYLAQLAEAKIDASPGRHPQSVWLQQSLRVDELPGFHEGWVSVQDESAMHAAGLLEPQPGETLLDLCAAPGGKTTHLAELMQNTGRIVACDVSRKRLELVNQNSRRLGISIIETRPVSREGAGAPDELFDAVLLDVPCSNTGVMAKRPEVRWRLGPRDLADLALVQRRLLELAVSRLKPEGRVVYSTCSIEPEENRRVVDAVLSQQPTLQVVKELQHVPGLPADGAYQALIRKSS
jgi:16S rRNA (cytosine967-C5)-methyltransferase